MQLHNVKSKTKRKKSVQVGRGGKRGKTSGRGTKGQGARAGRKIRPELRDTIKRIPKLRGLGKNSNKSIQVKPTIVDVTKLVVFKAGEKVSPLMLAEKGIISVYKGRLPRIKILGKTEEVIPGVNVVDCGVSASARASIEKAGGSVK